MFLVGFSRRLGLEAHERRTMLLMAALVATLICAYTVAKVLRDALFLSEFRGLELPYAYIGVALASAAFVWLESVIQRRFTSVAVSRVGQYLAIAFSATAAVVYPLAPHHTAAVFYLWTGSQAMLLLPHFWVLALDVWDSQRARRVFPVLGGFGLVGGLLGGAFAAWSLPFLHRAGLMWALSGLLIAAHLLTRVLERDRARRPSRTESTSTVSPWEIVRRSRYIQVFALGLALSVAVSTLVDFQFKLYIQRLYPNPHALTQFLGTFYVVLNAAALVFQFGVAGWLMRRFGLAASTGLQPTAVMLFAPVVAVATGGWGVIAMRWIQGVLFQTLGKPSSEIYYAAIHPNERRRIKPMIDTLAERWSDAAVGILLILVLHVLHVPLKSIAIGTAVIAAIWFVVLVRLNGYYGRAFRQVLSSRWLEPEEAPEALRTPAARRALVDALGGDDDRGVVLALELCRRARDPEISRAIPGCLRHRSPIVVRAAIETMESMRLSDPEGVIEGLLAGPDEGLRRAAVRYRLALDREPVAFARELLDGDDPVLRQYVVDALVDHPHRASGAMTAQWVDARIRSGTREDLLLAAQGLGAMTGQPLVSRLRTLLSNPDVEIRRAALISAARAPDRELLDVLLELLLVPELAFEARAAVAAIGVPAVPALLRLLEDERGEGVQASAASTLAHIGNPGAVQALTTLVRSGDVRLRQLGLKGLARARVRSGRPSLPRAMVHRLFLRELSEYRACREPGLAHADSMEPEVRLLAESYLESAEMALERAIAALACWYDPRPLAGVFERLKSPDHAEAAPALEYLGNVLPRAVFRSVTRMFETMKKDFAEDAPAFGTVSTLIEAAWASGDAWLRACAVRAARHAPNCDPGRFAGEGRDHPLVCAELVALAASVHATVATERPAPALKEAAC
jgi:ATP/ADP translocase/HEAT repeat protein